MRRLRTPARAAWLTAFAAVISVLAPAGGPAAKPRLIGYGNLNRPRGVAIDPAGLYVADTGNHRVLRLASGETEPRVVAGSQARSETRADQTSCGQSDPNSTSLCLPAGVTPTGVGTEVFIADTFDFRVLKIDSAGDATTVAGRPGQFDPRLGSGDGGLPTQAQLGSPWSVAFGASTSTYFISEREGHRIRRVDLVPNPTINTVAGSGILTPGEGVPATQAELKSPEGIAFDPARNELYFVDEAWHAVLKVRLSDLTLGVVAGMVGQPGFSGDGGPPTQAKLDSPQGLALQGCDLFVADTANHRVRGIDVCSPSPVIRTVAGSGAPGFSGDGGPATLAQLSAPGGVSVGAGGVLYIADTDNCRVRVVDAAGEIDTVLGRGCGAQDAAAPLHIAEPSPGYGVAYVLGPPMTFDGSRDYTLSFRLFVPRRTATYPYSSVVGRNTVTDLMPNHFFHAWNDHGGQVDLLLNTGQPDSPGNELTAYHGAGRFTKIKHIDTDRWIPIEISVHPQLGYYSVAVDGVYVPLRLEFPPGAPGGTRARFGDDTHFGCLNVEYPQCVHPEQSNHGEAFWDDIIVRQDGRTVFSESFDGPVCLSRWDRIADPATNIVECATPRVERGSAN